MNTNDKTLSEVFYRKRMDKAKALLEGLEEGMKGAPITGAPCVLVDPKDPIGRHEFEMLKCEFANLISNKTYKRDQELHRLWVAQEKTASEQIRLQAKVDELEGQLAGLQLENRLSMPLGTENKLQEEYEKLVDRYSKNPHKGYDEGYNAAMKRFRDLLDGPDNYDNIVLEVDNWEEKQGR